jgi:hypothetical protein
MNPAANDDSCDMDDHQTEPHIRANLMNLFRRFPADLLEAHVAGDSGCQGGEEHCLDGIAAGGVVPYEVLGLFPQAAQIVDHLAG